MPLRGFSWSRWILADVCQASGGQTSRLEDDALIHPTPDMTDHEPPKPLSLPIPFPDVPSFLVGLHVEREDVPALLGPPMLTGWVEGLGKADFWSFEYACGLQVAYRFLHRPGEGGVVMADSPEIAHVLRHIPFPERDCTPIDPATLQRELELLLLRFPERKAEVDALHAFQVWRQGEDGNPAKVGEPTSERDARCHVAQLEARGHKQTYWYRRV